MSNAKRKILTTIALPYGNGPIHLGHMLEHIQGDIWVRYQRMRGHEIYLVCADDAHGAPIMIQAAKLNITPEALIEEQRRKHMQDFAGFGISYDNYHSTHSEENQQLVELFYERLLNGGYIKSKQISQLFDPEKQMFLPDRFVKGICPNCKAEDQYGDNCEVCSSIYSPTDLIEPRSILSGATPVIKESEHLFFDLPAFDQMLQQWLKQGSLQKEVVNKMQEWFTEGLKQWDITRDAPYFGFRIPNTADKYFYVWLDAPIGYFASFKALANKHPSIDFDSFIREDSDAELYHFIGKDIMYFHSLFWPAMLEGANFRKPTNIFTHGYVTVNGAKMSKSRGTFIKANTYLKYIPAECLRYYYASKLTPKIEDIDLNLEDFMQKVNTDIVNKLVNIASRTAGFIHKQFADTLVDKLEDTNLLDAFVEQQAIIAGYYENLEFSKAIRVIMQLTDQANRYIDEQAPWVIAKQAEQQATLHQVCSIGINLFRILISYLKPVLPELAANAELFLQETLTWDNLGHYLVGHRLNKFVPLFKRIEKSQLDELIEASKAENQEALASNTNTKTETSNIETIADIINFEQFSQVDLRVAKVLLVEEVEGSDKLLRFEVDLGSETRQIFSGLKAFYQPAELLGKNVIIVANLAPRKMRFGISEGMILTASDKADQIVKVLTVDDGATAGMKIS